MDDEISKHEASVGSKDVYFSFAREEKKDFLYFRPKTCALQIRNGKSRRRIGLFLLKRRGFKKKWRWSPRCNAWCWTVQL